MKKELMIVVSLVFLSCGFPFITKQELPSSDFIATDSRLRVIFNAEQGIFSTTGQVAPQRIICTEPSPDVATTIATSLGGGLSALGYGSGSLSMEMAEGLVQLGERTAAIQLLRDKMYQTCVSYANGAITGTTYSLIMSRLDDAIVTLSLGDKAAGAFGGKLAAIGGKASAKAEATLMGLPGEISRIEGQAGKLAVANKKVDDAEKALKDHLSTGKPADKDKEAEYNKQTTELEGNLQQARKERDALLELMRGMAKSASNASGEITNLQAGGGITAKPDADVLHQMQADFLQPNVSRDLAFACMVELGQRDPWISVNPDDKIFRYNELLRVFKENYDKISNMGFFGGMFEEETRQAAKNYVAAILHTKYTTLAEWCYKNMDTILKAEKEADKMRYDRAKINAEITSKKIDLEIANKKLEAEKANAVTKDRESLIKLIDKCTTDFKSNEKKMNACLEKAWSAKPGELTVTPSPPITTPTGQRA